MIRAIVFSLTLKSLFESLGLITKPRLQTWLIIVSIQTSVKHLGWIWKPHNCLMLTEFNWSFVKVSPLRSLLAYCLPWLTEVMLRHNCHHCPLFSPTDVSLATPLRLRDGRENNWEFESVSGRFRPKPHTNITCTRCWSDVDFSGFHSLHCPGISPPREWLELLVTLEIVC